MIESTMTWGELIFLTLGLCILFSVIMGFWEAAREESECQKRREEARKWQLKWKEL